MQPPCFATIRGHNYANSVLSCLILSQVQHRHPGIQARGSHRRLLPLAHVPLRRAGRLLQQRRRRGGQQVQSRCQSAAADAGHN